VNLRDQKPWTAKRLVRLALKHERQNGWYWNTKGELMVYLVSSEHIDFLQACYRYRALLSTKDATSSNHPRIIF